MTLSSVKWTEGDIQPYRSRRECPDGTVTLTGGLCALLGVVLRCNFFFMGDCVTRNHVAENRWVEHLLPISVFHVSVYALLLRTVD